MNGNQIKDSLNLISMQMNGLRGAGEFGKFGTDMLRTMSQEWQKTEKKKDKKKKSADKNKKDLMQKEKKNNRTNGTAGKKETPQALSGSMAVGNIAAAPRGISLQEAFVWSEILGEPMAHKRRARRVNQRYGNQSNADRR